MPLNKETKLNKTKHMLVYLLYNHMHIQIYAENDQHNDELQWTNEHTSL